MQLDIVLILAILCAQCIYYSIDFYKIKTANPLLKKLIIAFLVFISISTFFGLIHDGLLADSHNYLLKLTIDYMNIIFLGIAIFLSWNICAAIFNSPTFSNAMYLISIITLIIYFIASIKMSRNFVVAIIYYCSAAFNMLVIFMVYYANSLSKTLALGILGIYLLLIASCLEQIEFEIKFLGLSSLGVLHVIICIAFYMVFSALKYILLQQDTSKR